MVKATATLRINNDIRRRIAEGLLLGHTAADVVRRLVADGIGEQDAEQEVANAARSPYIAAARRLQNRVAKRDWLLDTQRRLNRLRDPLVPRSYRLAPDEFRNAYYLAGRPVIVTGMMDACTAVSKWEPSYFRQAFRDRVIDAQSGTMSESPHLLLRAERKRSIKFAKFLDSMAPTEAGAYLSMTAKNSPRNRQSVPEIWRDIPPLPEYLAEGGAGHAALCFEPSGGITPFQHDIRNTLLAQVAGRRRVLLIPACEVGRVYNHTEAFSEVDGRNIDFGRYPDMRDVQVLSCTLSPGEMLLVPVGTFYFIEALDVSIGLSFTNFRWPNAYDTGYPSRREF